MRSIRKSLMISMTLLVVVVLIIYGGISIMLTKAELEKQAKNTIYLQSGQLSQLLGESNNNANLLEKSMLEGYDNTIVATTKLAMSVINHSYKKYLNGEYESEAAAQKDALDTIRDIWYGPVGYFWLDNNQYTLLVHALTPQKEGMNRYNLTDMTGFYLMRNITGNAIKYGSAFTDYTYAKPGFDPKLEFTKRGYSEYFVPWGWIPGTGNYIDDIDAKKKVYINESSALFMKKLIEISKEGDAYVFNADGTVAYHQDGAAIGKKLDLVDHNSGLNLFDVIVASKDNYIRYNTDGLDILAYVNYDVNSKQYIVVGKDYNKLMFVVKQSTYMMIGILMLAILISLAVSYSLSSTIAKPIKELRNAAEKVSNGDLNVTLPQDLKYEEIMTLTASLEMLIAGLKKKDK